MQNCPGGPVVGGPRRYEDLHREKKRVRRLGARVDGGITACKRVGLFG